MTAPSRKICILGASLWVLPILASAQQIVINEIMYHPSSENVLEEWIELRNLGSTNVDVTGWRFTAGVDFTLTNTAAIVNGSVTTRSTVTIPAGGYLVVAANVSRFRLLYSTVSNDVVGNWVGRLNNHDQTITLVHSNGTTIDSVRYADEGDWAVRRRGSLDINRRGWKWYAPHDGLGSSVELINPALPNDYGQNWASSPSNAPTPGRVNSALRTNIAPLILDVTHAPAVPRSTDNVTVTARILDETNSNLAVTLFYRVDAAPSFSSTNMLDDGVHGDGGSGDRIYGAVLPARGNDTVVEFYVQAIDGFSNARTWPAAALAAADGGVGSAGGQVVNALYQVDNAPANAFGGVASLQPVYKLIMTESERAELQAIPLSSDRNTDAEMNGTFISLDGTETLVRYLSSFRNRGHGSRGANPPNYRVGIRSDARWKDVVAFNLNAVNVPVQHFGAVLALKSGLAGADSRAVQVRVNNVNRMPTSAPNYGSYACNEDLGSDWAGSHYPNDPNGNIYRAIRDLAPADFDYRTEQAYPTMTYNSSTSPGSLQPNFLTNFGDEDKRTYTNTFYKSNNVSEDDWTDLIIMLQTMGLNGTTPFTPQNVRSVIDVDQWMLHMAVMALYGNQETGLNGGYNDDYSMYAGAMDRRFRLLFYDLDSILGIQSFGTTDSIFRNTSSLSSGQMMNRFIHHSSFEPIYYATLQRLLDTTFSQAQFDALVDQTLGSYAPATAATMKTHMNGRRSYVQGVISAFVPPSTNRPVATVSGEPRSPTPFTNATLAVSGNNITHYRYRLNSGAWSVEATVATPLAITGLAHNSTNTVFVVGRNSGGIYQDQTNPTVSRTWVVRTNTPRVRLNEILARNDSATNHSGTFPDIIELYNEGTSPISLGGMRLSDDPSNPGKFTIPATSLGVGSHLVLYADSAANPGIHTGFSLNESGEGVYLYNTVASGGELIDAVVFGPQVADKSIGRFGNGDWLLCQPSFGATNVAQALGNTTGVKINEILTSGQLPFPNDFIELYNADPLPVAVGGCYLTDEPIGAPTLTRVAALTFVPGGGHLALTADGSSGADHVDLQLSSEQGELALFSATGTMIDCMSYGPQRTGVTWGRCPDGALKSVYLSYPSPGSMNVCPTPAPAVQTFNLIPVNKVWRYLTNGPAPPAPNWTDPAYDDSGWNGSGPGVLGLAANPIPEPVSTTLGQNNNRYTYYFRAHFNVPANGNFVSLILSNYIDDGAVFYLNGVEVGRIRLPAAPVVIDPNSQATSITSTTWSLSESGTLNLSHIHPGDNVIAVEQHQNNPSSLDNIMAVRLDAVIATNSATAAGVVINEILANNSNIREADGSTPDWIELYNPSLSTVDLSDLSLTDSVGNPRRWVFPSGSFIAGQSHLVIRFDEGALPSATNTGFSLKADGDSIYLFGRPTNLVALDFVNFGLQTPDHSIGRATDGGTNWTLTTPTAGGPNIAVTLGDPLNLKVNEWMAAGSGDDWFEVYNPNAQPVALGGLWLSDKLSGPDLMKYRIPNLSFLGASTNGFKRFWADDPNTLSGADHVNFKLDGELGEAVSISTAGGVLINGMSFGPQQPGVSEGRLPDGQGYTVRFPGSDSPGDSNYLPLGNVVINEILTHTDAPLEDAVEVRNISGSPVDISGWFLSDTKSFLQKFVVPPETILQPGGFAVFYEYQFNPPESPGVAFSFSSANGDQVYLSESITNSQLTGYRATASFGPSANGVSFGRYVNSAGEADYVAMSGLSLGTAITAQSPPTQANLDMFRSGMGATNPYPKVGPVIVSEIMYHPPDLIDPGVSTNDNVVEEFIELRNTSGATVPLYATTNGWRLRDAVDFTFTSAHTIPAGGHLIVVSFDPATNVAARAQFEAAYGTNFLLVGPYVGKLDNSGDSVELVKPDPPQTNGSVPYVLVEKVVYSDTTPWSTNADGFGLSLQRVSATGYANDVTNWVAALPAPGGTGQPDTDGDGMPDDWEMANGLDKNSATDAMQDADGDGMTNLQEYLAGTDPQSFGSALRLSAMRNGNNVDLQFNAVAGRTYTIVWTATMPSVGAWTKLTDVPAQGGTGLVIVQDGPLSSGTQRFYRVVTPAQP